MQQGGMVGNLQRNLMMADFQRFLDGSENYDIWSKFTRKVH
jgi:hypothetical protein